MNTWAKESVTTLCDVFAHVFTTFDGKLIRRLLFNFLHDSFRIFWEALPGHVTPIFFFFFFFFLYVKQILFCFLEKPSRWSPTKKKTRLLAFCFIMLGNPGCKMLTTPNSESGTPNSELWTPTPEPNSGKLRPPVCNFVYCLLFIVVNNLNMIRCVEQWIYMLVVICSASINCADGVLHVRVLFYIYIRFIYDENSNSLWFIIYMHVYMYIYIIIHYT